jgi:hypothetical protein
MRFEMVDRTAETALEDAWRQLAPVVDKARVHREEIMQDPKRADDPEAATYVRWLNTFDQELATIETLHEAARELSASDLRAARTTAEKVLGAFEQVAAQKNFAR